MSTSSGFRNLLVIAAGVGFVLSLLCNIVARAGLLEIPKASFTPLLAGVFVVFIPTVLSVRKFKRLEGDWFGLKALKYIGTGAPDWMRWAVIALFGYMFVNFFTAAASAPHTGAAPDEVFVISGSGHAMLFYGVCVWINYAALRREELGIKWACQRGHAMGPEDKFCAECGAPMNAVQARGEQV